MPIYDLFSKRQADAAKAGQPDVYQYETIPDPLREQIKQIATDALGAHMDHILWKEAERTFLREKGLDGIFASFRSGERILGFMGGCYTEDWLDLLELIAVGIASLGSELLSTARMQSKR